MLLYLLINNIYASKELICEDMYKKIKLRMASLGEWEPLAIDEKIRVLMTS